MKCLPVFHRQVDHVNQCLYIVAIHMENRRKNSFSNVGAIGARPRVFKIGGEANLVIDHHMDGAACAVAFQFFHLQHLVYNTLAGNRCIAMDQYRGYFGIIAVVFKIDLRAGQAFNYRVNRF